MSKPPDSRRPEVPGHPQGIAGGLAAYAELFALDAGAEGYEEAGG